VSLPDGVMDELLLLLAPSSTAKEPCMNTGKTSAPVVQGAAVLDDEAKLIIQISRLKQGNYNIMDHMQFINTIDTKLNMIDTAITLYCITGKLFDSMLNKENKKAKIL
jgi:hypothetical protein